MKKLFNYLKQKHYMYYIIIILIALLVCSPLTVKGQIKTHDGVYHLARTFGTVQALKQGQIPPNIISNFCKGFGYSWNIFYPPLSTYIATIFRLFVPTYVTATKLTIIFAVIISGISMFQLMKKITRNLNTALITSIIYITNIYFINNIYERGALGEILSYMFFPILLNGLYSIFYDKGKNNWLLTIGAVGILLSHNISSLFAIIVCGIYVLLNIKNYLIEILENKYGEILY